MRLGAGLVSLLLFCSAAFAGRPALVVIDMQEEFWKRKLTHELPANQAKVEKVLRRQVELIRLAKQEGVPILLVEYSNSGPTFQVLKDEIGNYSNAELFIKSENDLFDAENSIASALSRHLDRLKITDLIMVGANGGMCVKCSVESALKERLRVWTDPQAIVDFNSPEFLYPYHYDSVHLSISKELFERLKQRPGLKSFDEILGPEGRSAPGCLKDLPGLLLK